MKTTLDFIADIKQRHGIESDYAAAKLMNVSKMTLSSYRNGKTGLGDEVALKVADLLEIDPAYVIACVHAEREKNQTIKTIWERIATHAQGAAVIGLVVALLPFVDTSEFGAQNAAFVGAISLQNNSLRDVLVNSVYYVKW